MEEVKVPSLDQHNLVPIPPRRSRLRAPALTITGDGRIVFNIASMYRLAPDPRKPLRAVKMYLAQVEGKRYLVVHAARKGERDSTLLHPIGDRSHDRWPATTMVRAAGILEMLGIRGAYRCVGVYDAVHGWLVFDIDHLKPFETKADPEKLGAIERWLATAERGRTLTIQEALEEINATNRASGVPSPFSRPQQLSTFLRVHLDHFVGRVELEGGGRLGVKILAGGAGSPLPSSVTAEAEVEAILREIKELVAGLEIPEEERTALLEDARYLAEDGDINALKRGATELRMMMGVPGIGETLKQRVSRLWEGVLRHEKATG